MADNSRLRCSTEQEVQDTLSQLESLWDDLGLTDDQKNDRKTLFYGHLSNLLEKILLDERALKASIIKKIEHNTFKIIKLCEELRLEPEDSVDDELALLDLDAVLQERVKTLQQTKAERLANLRKLQDEDERLCMLLCETPYPVTPGVVPGSQDLKAVQDHIKTMKKEKEEREATYTKLRDGLLEFLEQLEESPDCSFVKDVVYSGEEEVSLSQATIHQLKNTHSDLEFRVKENLAKSLELRERITALYGILEVSLEDQHAFLATAPSHTPSSLAKLEAELGRLKILRLHNMSVIMGKLQKELAVWWKKCHVSKEEQEKMNKLTSGEPGEDTLVVLEEEVQHWKAFYVDNQELFTALEHFLSLFGQMMELDEREKDPSRLFNTRGGALLLEEKAKKKVKIEMPRVEEHLQALAETWREREGRPFMVNGKELQDYLKNLWETYEHQKEEEKAKRVQARDGKKPAGGTPARSAALSRKRGAEGDDQLHGASTSAKRSKHLMPPPHNATTNPSNRSRSPSKFRRSPVKTPRGRPLMELNRPMPPSITTTSTVTTAMSPNSAPSTLSQCADLTLQSITYDKFKIQQQNQQ